MIFSLGLIGLVFSAQAQQNRNPGEEGRRPRSTQSTIKGTVVEGEGQGSLIGANVLLKTLTDSLLNAAVTDNDGYFELSWPRGNSGGRSVLYWI